MRSCGISRTYTLTETQMSFERMWELAELCTVHTAEILTDYSLEFEELVEYIVPNHSIPQNTEEGLHLCMEITNNLKQLGF